MATLAPSGLLVVDRAIERYPVRPDGVTVVSLVGDDELTVIDRYGGQVAELTVAGAGFGTGEPRSERLFGPDSAPGSAVTFTAIGDTTVTVGAPGGRVVDGDTPATELALEVRRATPRQEAEAVLPPWSATCTV